MPTWVVLLSLMMTSPSVNALDEGHFVRGGDVRGGNGGPGGSSSVNIYGGTIILTPQGGTGGTGGNANPTPGPSNTNAPASGSAKPSFACSSASHPDEEAICSDPGLAALDRQMADAYTSAMSRADGTNSTNLRQIQRNWLQQRSECLSDRGCIRAAYQARISQLRNWP